MRTEVKSCTPNPNFGRSVDEADARKMIRRAGGRFFDRHNPPPVAAKDRTYAMCPISLTKEDVARLSDHPEFKLGEQPFSCDFCLLHIAYVPYVSDVTQNDLCIQAQRLIQVQA